MSLAQKRTSQTRMSQTRMSSLQVRYAMREIAARRDPMMPTLDSLLRDITIETPPLATPTARIKQSGKNDRTIFASHETG
ncbi:hypothetical protein D7S86_12680 [Pararobbsia silviterrae]|uniref:Uncharacterized protein n=1 Tax=Pararobbsia silviterrae TaxID=1792498 RepID=A0A494XXS6_9BURK|nr:hypothetical protein D7S86_12680 [Pararobbsia silviterrae]